MANICIFYKRKSDIHDTHRPSAVSCPYSPNGEEGSSHTVPPVVYRGSTRLYCMHCTARYTKFSYKLTTVLCHKTDLRLNYRTVAAKVMRKKVIRSQFDRNSFDNSVVTRKSLVSFLHKSRKFVREFGPRGTV